VTVLCCGLFACGGPSTADDPSCASGERWTGGNHGSSLMHPGRDCIECHDRGEGPSYELVGTVYEGLAERNDCLGVPDVVVELKGADGATQRVTSNDAGNFALHEVTVEAPYTVRLLYEGRERAMTTAQTSFGCAECHTATGANDAPGRILAP